MKNEVIKMENEEKVVNNSTSTMEFNLNAMGSALLQLEKGKNEELQDKFYTLDFFAVIDNKATGETMICFSVEEIEGKYFWASTSLFELLMDNAGIATEDPEARALYFEYHEVKIKYNGKTPLKNDPTKSCNVWKFNVNKK